MLFIVNLHCITGEKKRQRKLELIKFDKELSNPVLFKHQQEIFTEYQLYSLNLKSMHVAINTPNCDFKFPSLSVGHNTI